MKIYPDPNSGDNERRDGVRPPPPPPITIRTMDSDVKSVEESGGGNPQGETLNIPPPIRPEAPKPPEESEKIKIPGYSGPEKGVFQNDASPILGTNSQENMSEKEDGKLKSLVTLIVIILAAGIIGVGAYYYVYPLLLKNGGVVPPTPPTATEPPPTPAHVSLIFADVTEEALNLQSASPETIEEGEVLLKEVILSQNGNALKLSEYLPALIPELSEEELKNNFEENFTAFIYYNESGAWPGYVLKRKSSAVAIIAQNSFRKVEGSSSLKNFFLSDPGVPSSNGFQTGQVNNEPARYISFNNQGAALSYAWFNDYLLISTNYIGAQEAGDRLAF